MKSPVSNSAVTPLGQIALHRQFCPQLPEPWVHSYVLSGARRTVESQEGTEEFYPFQYQTDGSPLENLRFALKYEPLDLRIVACVLQSLGPAAVAAWVRKEPTGAYSRRAWFLYEKFVDLLDLPDVSSGNYVDALDSQLHYVAGPINSKRHRVRDNLLGNSNLCPVVRRSARLRTMAQWDLQGEALQITQAYSPETVARAIRYLYTKETRSSYALEGETPSPQREERFLQALLQADRFLPADKSKLLQLQASILDPRYAASDYRDFQNFVAETTRGFGQHVHFICPRPEDVGDLMDGWLQMTDRLSKSAVDAVVAAAASAFAFVFIHPFEDGNGRSHRFLIHALLASRGFGPKGVLLPVSAAILRQRAEYDRVLEAFSRPVMRGIDWRFLEDSTLGVSNPTRDLYRLFDATPQAEFLYERIAESIRIDLKDEATFLELFDATLQAIRTVVDMPDNRAAQLAQICLSNQGRLSRRKRNQFGELTDSEIARIEQEIIDLLATDREE